MAAKKHSGPFIVAFGGEDFLLDRMIELGRSWADRRVVVLDADGMADHEVVSVCEQRSFDGRDVVVVLDNAHKIKGDKALKTFIEEKSREDNSVVVVAICRTDKLSELWKKAAEKGRTQHFPACKPWESDKVKQRMVAEAERLGLKLEDDVPDAFLRFIGDDLRRVVNELRKLKLITPEGVKVTKKAVLSVLAPDVPVEPFEVAEAATNKDVKRAMTLVSFLFKNMGDGAAVPITASLCRQVEKLIVARQMLDKGDEISVIATRLGIHAFPLQKDVLPRARKFTVGQLLTQMNNLCRLDAQVKGPARSKRTLVELTVLSIAA